MAQNINTAMKIKDESVKYFVVPFDDVEKQAHLGMWVYENGGEIVARTPHYILVDENESTLSVSVTDSFRIKIPNDKIEMFLKLCYDNVVEWTSEYRREQSRLRTKHTDVILSRLRTHKTR